MSAVLDRGSPPRETARVRHTCGALVEFERKDVHGDQRDGDYVVCPACKKTPWIAESVLRWTRRRSA